jgi:hypothetical protein
MRRLGDREGEAITRRSYGCGPNSAPSARAVRAVTTGAPPQKPAVRALAEARRYLGSSGLAERMGGLATGYLRRYLWSEISQFPKQRSVFAQTSYHLDSPLRSRRGWSRSFPAFVRVFPAGRPRRAACPSVAG